MAADVIREAIIRLGVELSKDGLNGADLGQQTAAFKQYNEEVSKASQEHNQLNAAAVETQKQFKEAERAQKAYSEASAQAQEANIRAADAAKQAGDGAFTAARGFALLAASNEESAAEMLKAIAVAQGAFDIFKGGVDVVRGLYEANKALTAASAAATAAEAAKAGAITATGAAATATTPKLVAMNAAMGPIGIAMLAISAAAVAGVAIWRSYGDSGEDALDRLGNKMDEARRKQELLNEAIEDGNRERDRFRSVLDPDAALDEIRREQAGFTQETGDDITGDFVERRNRFERNTRNLPNRPRKIAMQLQAERDELIARLGTEEEETRRQQDLAEEAARIQVRQREDRLRDINRQLDKFKDNPAAALRGDTAELEAERSQLNGEIKALKESLVESFRSFRDAILDLQRETRELKELRNLGLDGA